MAAATVHVAAILVVCIICDPERAGIKQQPIGQSTKKKHNRSKS